MEKAGTLLQHVEHAGCGPVTAYGAGWDPVTPCGAGCDPVTACGAGWDSVILTIVSSGVIPDGPISTLDEHTSPFATHCIQSGW